MPRVSEFYGIAIYMYYNDHAPPHFHAEYAEREELLAIDDLRTLRGKLGRRARALVVEWAALHQNELIANWDRARQGIPLEPIDPLD
jgi:hypothetical protein